MKIDNSLSYAIAIHCFQIWRNENCEVARLVISKSMEKRKKFVKVELMARQWILYCQMIRFKYKVSSSKHKRARAMLYLSACIVFCVMIWWITSYIWNLLLKRHSCTTDLNAKIHIIMSLMLSTKKLLLSSAFHINLVYI